MRRVILSSIAAAALLPGIVFGQSLRGSNVSVDRQNTVARQHDFTFLRTSAEVRRFADLGLLVRLKGNAHYELAAVSQPYARPAVQVFVERLSVQYMAACGEKLVVTSLTRPTTRQPRNASDLSVHPAGMAVDLRISNKASCRRWLESTLLSLEKASVLEATRERRPAHYHIAVFPTSYVVWVDQLERRRRGTAVVAAAAAPAATERAVTPAPAEPAAASATVPVASATTPAAGADVAPPAVSSSGETGPDPTHGDPAAAEPAMRTVSYRVNRGDTLWSIAQKHATSVAELKQLNGLRTSRIAAGQKLVVPVSPQ